MYHFNAESVFKICSKLSQNKLIVDEEYIYYIYAHIYLFHSHKFPNQPHHHHHHCHSSNISYHNISPICPKYYAVYSTVITRIYALSIRTCNSYHLPLTSLHMGKGTREGVPDDDDDNIDVCVCVTRNAVMP